MADEPVAGATAELGLTIDGFLKALDKAGKAGANFEKSIQREMDKISGTKATEQAAKIGIAFERLGGISKITGQQLENLRTRIDALSKAGAKLPSSLAGLAGGPGLGQLGKNVETQAFGALQGQLGPLGALLNGVSGSALVAAAGIGAVVVAAGAAAGAVGAASVAFASLVLDVADTGSHLKDLSAQTGISTQGLQQLKLAGSLVGVSLEEITGAVAKMSKGIIAGDDIFRRLGLSIKDLKALAPEQQFEAVAAAISALPSPTERAAAAMAVFGNSGAQLLPLLTSDLKAAREEAERLGFVMSDQTVAAADKLDDEVTKLSAAWVGFKTNMAAAFIESGTATQIVGGLTDGMAGLSKTLRDNQDTIRGVAIVVGFLVGKLKELASGLGGGKLAGEFAKIGQALRLFEAQETARLALAGVFDKPTVGGGKGLGAPKKDLEAQQKLLKQINEQYTKINDAALAVAESIAEGAAQIEVFAQNLGNALAALSNKQVLEGLFKAPEIINVPQAQMAEAVLRQQIQDTVLLQRENEKRIATEKRIAAALRATGQISKKEYKQIIDDLDAATAKGEGMVKTLTSIGQAMHGLADILGGFSEMWGEIGHAIAGVFEDIAAGADKFQAIAKGVAGIGAALSAGGHEKAGGALSGAASGALTGAAIGSIIPGIGTAVGAVVGGVAGLLGGILGGAKKAAARLKKQQEEAINAFAGAFDAWKAAGKELGGLGAEGINQLVGALFDDQGKFTGEFTSAGNAAAYVAAQFQALLKAGYSTTEALEALGPAAQAILKDPKQFQGTAAAPILQLVQFSTANEKLLQFVDGLGKTAASLAGFGLLTQDLALSLGTDLANSIEKMIGKGLTQEQALGLSAQALYNLQQAAQQNNVTLDAHTQKLIDDAEAAGLFKNLEDPLQKVVEATQATAVAMASLVTIMGGTLPAALQKLVDEFNSAQFTPAPTETPPTGPGGSPPEVPEFQTGGVFHGPAGGGLAWLHDNERVLPPGIAGFGNIHYSPVININGSGLNEQQLLRITTRAVQTGEAGLRTAIVQAAQGKS